MFVQQNKIEQDAGKILYLFPLYHISDTFTVRDIQERLSHGRQLKIYLPKSVDKLEFTPASEPGKTFEYWTTRSMSRHLHKGYVSGTGSDRRWYLDKVTFDDEGTYTQKDYWNKEISTLKVAVTSECVRLYLREGRG